MQMTKPYCKKGKSRKIKPLCAAIGCALTLSSINVYAAEDNTEEDEAESTVVITTGSRIRSDEINDTVPIQIILADEAVDRGLTTVGQLLRESTLASGSAQVTAATSTAFVQNGGTGAETVSLRGLGANRTLVLLNGRRAGPAGTRGTVSSFDFNTIPLSAVSRIEILKDGSSSLYGSDAVAGVINIILKTGDGGSIDVFTSQPTDSGGEQSRISATWGETFDNSSIRLTLDHDKRSELSNGQRDYFDCGETYFFDPATGSRADLIDPRTGSSRCSSLAWGHVWLYDYSGGGNITPESGRLAQFDYDGDLGNYINPIAPGNFSPPPGWFLVNGTETLSVTNADHPFQDLRSLIPESDRTTFLVNGDYSISDTTTAYAELLYNRRNTVTNGFRQFWTFKYSEDFSIFGPGGDPLSAGWSGDQLYSPTAITDHSGSDITVDYTRIAAGINGELGDWYWDASVQLSRSDADYTNKIIFQDSIHIADFTKPEFGGVGSCVGQVTAVRGVACIDVPWLDPQFLAGNIDQQYRDFLFGEETGNTLYKQNTVEATISGELFEMPHGSAQAAFGLQYQNDEIIDTPGEQTLASNVWGASSAGITRGKTETYAVFGEFQFPLLADLPGIEELNFIGSARYTDIPDVASDTTYKAGLAWHIGEGVTIRGSKGTSFRTPSLFELFLNNQSAFSSQLAVDPCIGWQAALDTGTVSQTLADNCAADGVPGNYAGGAITATVITGGGFGSLESETSESNTWGIVWRPDFANLSVSLDYFDFLIENEVSVLGAGTITSLCYNSTSFATDPICSQFDRDPFDNSISEVRATFINIAKQNNSGYDFRVEYQTDLPVGKLSLRTEHTIQEESSQETLPGSFRDFNGRIGEPKHTGNFLAQFDKDNWYVSWFTNFVGKGDNTKGTNPNTEFGTFLGNPIRRVLRVGGTSYHSLSFGYNHEETGLSAVVGIRNLTDKIPPRISNGGGTRRGDSAFYSQYDFVGRSYFLNVKYDF